jgi:hypothetical protein
MPLRVFSILTVLIVATLGLFGFAWLTGSELYFFIPTRYQPLLRPPTSPFLMLGILAIPTTVTIMSRHYGLLIFMLFPLGLLVGTVVGWLLFDWTPSWCQHLLATFAILLSVYGWSQRGYLDY